MKTVLTSLLLIFASLSWAQEPTAAIENMEENVLFRGYENQIVITSHPKEGSAYTLTGSNVVVTKKGDRFIVRPGSGKTAFLTVSERSEDGRTHVIRKKEYRVKNLPDPSLYWGWTQAGKALQNPKPELTCGYVDYFQMDVNFTVVSWEAEYDGQMYSGEGTDISSLIELINSFTELTEFTIFAKVQGPDGITRKIDGTWFIRPTVDEEK